MKTFRTTGTGSEQTLSEIESDKIPIYPSVQDIEDDLANLEEGQIVATPDTGNEVAQPVDVVKKDNLHAVTSNAVSESLSYSTDEQKTGGYWIDGKPIYRKTIDTGNLPNNTSKSIAHNILNLDRIIRLYGNAYRASDKTFLPLPYPAISSSDVIDVNVQNTNIYIYTGRNRSDFTGDIILEYTKTTD